MSLDTTVTRTSRGRGPGRSVAAGLAGSGVAGSSALEPSHVWPASGRARRMSDRARADANVSREGFFSSVGGCRVSALAAAVSTPGGESVGGAFFFVSRPAGAAAARRCFRISTYAAARSR